MLVFSYWGRCFGMDPVSNISTATLFPSIINNSITMTIIAANMYNYRHIGDANQRTFESIQEKNANSQILGLKKSPI